MRMSAISLPLYGVKDILKSILRLDNRATHSSLLFPHPRFQQSFVNVGKNMRERESV